MRFAQGEGYLQVGHDRALILVEEAGAVASSTRATWEEKLRRAEERASDAEEGTHPQPTADARQAALPRRSSRIAGGDSADLAAPGARPGLARRVPPLA